MVMDSMDFFMDKIHGLEDEYSKLLGEFRTFCLNPFVYPKSVKQETFEKLEKTHKELVSLHFKQKSDFKDHQRLLNKDLKKYIDESLRKEVLTKILDLSEIFDNCIKLQEKTMIEVRKMNDINFPLGL